jgi:hypothetical protein
VSRPLTDLAEQVVGVRLALGLRCERIAVRIDQGDGRYVRSADDRLLPEVSAT